VLFRAVLLYENYRIFKKGLSKKHFHKYVKPAPSAKQNKYSALFEKQKATGF
jgi:hypothetical protein